MTANAKLRVGIMGGTFDPIHNGHLILAECAYEQYHLDKVLFLPSGNPPHKKERPDGASDRDRLEMVSLAIADNPHFYLEKREMERSGYTYTYETLQMLCSSHPDTEYYFIIGADSLMAFDTWKNPRIICQHCVLLAAIRDDLPSELMQQKADELRARYGARIYFLDSPQLDISSTDLRRRFRNHRTLRYYVPDCIREYIETHEIYKRRTDLPVSDRKPEGC